MKKSIPGVFDCDLPEVNPGKFENRALFAHQRDAAVRRAPRQRPFLHSLVNRIFKLRYTLRRGG
ncbi:MAG: hypothetical protein ACT4NU_13460 [Chromatiales bacterium]